MRKILNDPRIDLRRPSIEGDSNIGHIIDAVRLVRSIPTARTRALKSTKPDSARTKFSWSLPVSLLAV